MDEGFFKVSVDNISCLGCFGVVVESLLVNFIGVDSEEVVEIEGFVYGDNEFGKS